MSKMNGMKLYEEINNISPELIEEAGSYEKAGNVRKYGKGHKTVIKLIAAGAAVAAAVIAVTGIQSTKVASNGESDIVSKMDIAVSHVMSVYAADMNDVKECLYADGQKNADISGVTFGCMVSSGDSYVSGSVYSNIRVEGEAVSNINYSLISEGTDYTYSLARLKEVEKDSPEYVSASEKFRKKTDEGYSYYIIEDIGTEYKTDNVNQDNGVQILKFTSKADGYNRDIDELLENVCDVVTLQITVTFEDKSTEMVKIGFKVNDDSDNSGEMSYKITTYVKTA